MPFADTKTVNFIPASSLFGDFKLAWNEFIDYANDVTWGDVVHSLVKPSKVVSILKNAYNDTRDISFALDSVAKDEIESVLGRLQFVSEDTFIDLET